jgi:hypothetical protein
MSSSFDSNILLNWPTPLSGNLDFEAFLTDVHDIAWDGCVFDLSTDLNCVPSRAVQGESNKIQHLL